MNGLEHEIRLNLLDLECEIKTLQKQFTQLDSEHRSKYLGILQRMQDGRELVESMLNLESAVK